LKLTFAGLVKKIQIFEVWFLTDFFTLMVKFYPYSPANAIQLFYECFSALSITLKGIQSLTVAMLNFAN